MRKNEYSRKNSATCDNEIKVLMEVYKAVNCDIGDISELRPTDKDLVERGVILCPQKARV